jgi:hypothetical protein
MYIVVVVEVVWWIGARSEQASEEVEVKVGGPEF